MLAEDEGGATGRAALLGVGVGEQRPLLGDAVDVRGAVTHHAEVVGAQVVDPDVVAPDDEDVGLLRRCLRLGRRRDRRGPDHDQRDDGLRERYHSEAASGEEAPGIKARAADEPNILFILVGHVVRNIAALLSRYLSRLRSTGDRSASGRSSFLTGVGLTPARTR